MRGPEEVEKRRRYEIRVQECFCGFAWTVYSRILDYANSETFELCLHWDSVAWREKNQSEAVKKSGDGSMLVAEENKMDLRCSLQLESEIGPYTPSTEQEGDEFFKYALEREIMEDR